MPSPGADPQRAWFPEVGIRAMTVGVCGLFTWLGMSLDLSSRGEEVVPGVILTGVALVLVWRVCLVWRITINDSEIIVRNAFGRRRPIDVDTIRTLDSTRDGLAIRYLPVGAVKERVVVAGMPWRSASKRRIYAELRDELRERGVPI